MPIGTYRMSRMSQGVKYFIYAYINLKQFLQKNYTWLHGNGTPLFHLVHSLCILDITVWYFCTIFWYICFLNWFMCHSNSISSKSSYSCNSCFILPFFMHSCILFCHCSFNSSGAENTSVEMYSQKFSSSWLGNMMFKGVCCA